ncbi:restriction endonuclease subunit S [Azospira restricta]|uniref:Restriction endonuclease subunit S n=1 Tax=Azospira restricta TaxID=404405 RepID=A0A974PXH2_9RHOO|nr:restriction endonuclease subunit S [Azospira restricta]QRJ63049.1 restriction endonuclease subunit S [Azospira restricta]
MSFPRYPEYKDSGVEWLREVPAHWGVKRLRFVADLNPSKSELASFDRSFEVSFLPMEAIGDDGSLNLERTRPIGEVETGYTYFREGDVTVAKITPCFENGKGAVMRGLISGVGFGTTELVVARPKATEATSEYLHWLFISRPFRQLGEAAMYGAGGQKRVPDEFVRNFAVAFPDVAEQGAIAAFLDHETAKIDALVAEQEKLIALLKEKRQAVISHAVTKGLNPDAPMKDSGIEWLGEVPAHWEVGLLKRFSDVLDCKHHTVQFLDEGLPIVSIRELRDDRIALNDAKLTSQDEWDFLRDGRVPQRGDMIFCRNASVGAVGYVDFDAPFCMGQDVCLIRSNSKSRFMHFQLTSNFVRNQIEAFLVGATIRRANVEEIRGLLVTSPPVGEQEVIAEFLMGAITKFDALSADAEKAIALLKERRTALISAAVTGKIDVRGFAAAREAA